MPEINIEPFIPVLITIVTALIVVVLDISFNRNSERWTNSAAVTGLLLALYFSFSGLESLPESGFGKMVIGDSFGRFFQMLFAIGALLTLLLSYEFIKRERLEWGEYTALVLFSTAGMMVMVSANDLIVLFLGIELMSIPAYVLAGFLGKDGRSLESAIKYFLLGAFASGFLLYGIAMLYGATGTTSLEDIGSALIHGEEGANLLPYMGIALLLTGLGFKIASFPFHMWTPDVYEGAPTPVTGYLSVGVKAAAFASIFRILAVALSGYQEVWTGILWGMAVATMIAGNLSALVQTDVKRMLAYSSIAHAGYLLVGLTAGGVDGGKAITFYLLAYTFMNLGAFGIVMLLEKQDGKNGRRADFSRLGFKRPALAAAMSIFMFSLAGIPPLAGFWSKWYIFTAAIGKGYLWLVVIGVLNSAVAVYYYIRIVVIMYMQPAGTGEELETRTVEGETSGTVVPGFPVGWSAALALLLSVGMVLHMGLFPDGYVTRALVAVKIMFQG